MEHQVGENPVTYLYIIQRSLIQASQEPTASQEQMAWWGSRGDGVKRAFVRTIAMSTEASSTLILAPSQGQLSCDQLVET